MGVIIRDGESNQHKPMVGWWEGWWEGWAECWKFKSTTGGTAETNMVPDVPNIQAGSAIYALQSSAVIVRWC